MSSPIFKHISFFLICANLIFLYPQSSFASQPQESYRTHIDAIAERIEERYGFDIRYKKAPTIKNPKIIYAKTEITDYPELLRYIRLLEDEINKYPPSFFKNCRLRNIIFVKKLFFNEKPVEGAYSLRDNAILFDFSRYQRNVRLLRHTIHHEFYHMVELLTIGYPGWKDQEWASLNQEGFTYTRNSRARSNQTRKAFSSPPYPGFTTHYAATAIEEDKAEIFANLMMPKEHKLILKWAKDDSVLQNKVAYMKNFIYSFCKEMDKAYWMRILNKQ